MRGRGRKEESMVIWKTISGISQACIAYLLISGRADRFLIVSAGVIFGIMAAGSFVEAISAELDAR